MCSCSSFSSYNSSGNMMHLPFIIIPFITTRLSLNVQYGLSFCGILFLLLSKPCMMCSFSCCRCLSCSVVCCISCTDIHSEMSVAVCITSIFFFMPGVLLSLLSTWFCKDIQSAMNRSVSGLCSYSDYVFLSS